MSTATGGGKTRRASGQIALDPKTRHPRALALALAGMSIGPVIAATVTASFVPTSHLPMPHPFAVHPITRFKRVFGITVGFAAVGLLRSFGRRNFRFLANGSHIGSTAGARLVGTAAGSEAMAILVPALGKEPPNVD